MPGACPLCADDLTHTGLSSWWHCRCGAWVNFHTHQLYDRDLPVPWPRSAS